ncbi:hypothetical protein ACM66B_003177 [Microbotryomycetes sp. NB124-2]
MSTRQRRSNSTTLDDNNSQDRHRHYLSSTRQRNYSHQVAGNLEELAEKLKLPLKSPKSLLDEPTKLTQEQLSLPTTLLYAQKFQQQQPQQRQQQHFGDFVDVRNELDWEYHECPTKERQELQDEIVKAVLRRIEDTVEHVHVDRCGDEDVAWRDRDENKAERGVGDGKDGGGVRIGGSSEEAEIRARMKLVELQEEKRLGKTVDRSHERVALFTAGGMGAGKGHTLRQLLKDGTVKLAKDFVWVDPDSLARSLPEREQYIRHNPKTASKLLHPEAAMLQEILSGVAQQQSRTLVVDGSLSDCAWFGQLMKKYRSDGYECEILFVTAPEDTMISRAERRAKITGRFTDPEAIKFSRLKSPECVSRLSTPDHVRRVRLIDNSSDSAPPTILYDSNLDPDWQQASRRARHPNNDTSGSESDSSCAATTSEEMVDVKAFVEGRARQREQDGKVVSVEDPQAELDRRKRNGKL